MGGGAGFLRNDWLTQTTDPTPVFSLLVSFTSRYLDERFFYLYHALLSGIYIYSLLGIATLLFGFQNSKPKQLILLTVIAGMHSPLFADLSYKFVKFNLWHLNSGVANKWLLGPNAQPATFGVLFILSIYLFLLDRPLPATLTGTLAATIHPSYLLGAATLVLSYMTVTMKRHHDARGALRIASWALIATLPILLYTCISFRPTTIELMGKANDILVNFRIPHHARIADWLDALVYVKLAMVGLAIYLVRKTALAPVLSIALLVATTLTIIQALTGSNSLALILPWRLSVFLVPISVSIIVAFCMFYVFKRVPALNRHEWLLSVFALAILSFLVLTGASRMASSFAHGPDGPEIPMMEFVKRTSSPTDIYLIPAEMEGFRLYAGASVVIDFESIPYKDVEVLEWYGRIQSIDLLYGLEGGSYCGVLRSLAERYRASHIVVKTLPQQQICKFMELSYKDNAYSIYRLKFAR